MHSGGQGLTGRQACLGPGHAAVHTHGLHTHQPPVSLHGAPAAPVEAQPHLTGPWLLCHAWAYICHKIWVHTHQQKFMYTEPWLPLQLYMPSETIYVWAHVCSQHACTYMNNMCTHKQKCLCMYTSSVHTIQGLQTHPHTHTHKMPSAASTNIMPPLCTSQLSAMELHDDVTPSLQLEC